MRYFLGVMALTGYVLLLSTFVSENVEGGVAGGNKVDTQRVGRTIVTTYDGGEKIVYGANAGYGRRLRIVSAVTFGIGIVLAVFLAGRREAPVGQLVARSFGMAFVGVVIAFITGMPLAVVLKEVPPAAFWIRLPFSALPVCSCSVSLVGRSTNLELNGSRSQSNSKEQSMMKTFASFLNANQC